MRMKTLSSLIALGLAGVALQAHAVDERWYVAPTVSYVFADGDRESDDGAGLGIALGKALNDNWNVEFGARGNRLDFDTPPGRYDQTSLGLDALRFFSRDAAFAPYAVLGVGYLRTEVPGTADNSVMANVGLGFLKQLSENIALRADARYRLDNNAGDYLDQGSFGDWIVSVGLNIALGQKAAPAPVAKPEPAPAPAPIVAPAPEPKPAAAPADSDGDGVTDDKDRCPKTPAGRKVDANGCELDGDGDGVVDALDKCPKTPKGDKVDASGCSVIILNGVNFDNDSAKLRADALPILDDAINKLKTYDEIKLVEVAGHTDSRQSDAYNQRLSERRAKAVMDYLVSKGVPADKLTSKGYGESQPVTSNATREGRAKNRRVELRIQN